MDSLCLVRNLAPMFSLWEDVFNTPRFDNIAQLETLIRTMAVSDFGFVFTEISRAGRRRRRSRRQRTLVRNISGRQVRRYSHFIYGPFFRSALSNYLAR